jgi:ketosteroid isomerase-like protein
MVERFLVASHAPHLVYAEATSRDTGRAFVNHEAHVWTFRDGKLARFQSYHDTVAAAAAHRGK